MCSYAFTPTRQRVPKKLMQRAPQIHGHVRGHVSLRPAAERVADPGRRASVADDATEQTADADGAVAIEDRQAARRCAGSARAA